MADPVKIMVLPASVNEALPQVLFDDGGIWREPSRAFVSDKESTIRQGIEGLLTSVMELVGHGAQVSPQTPNFRKKFGDLYKLLLPVEVRDALKDAAAPAGAEHPQLNVYFKGATEWIPWELLHDGKQFLGLQFMVTRWPIVAQATGVRPPRKCVVRKVYSLLANHVLEGAELASWATTFDGFAKGAGWECRFPSNGANNYPTAVQLLDDPVDAGIVHVTCHGGLKDPSQSEYYWTLDSESARPIEYLVTPSIAKEAGLTQRPLVFGNACASAAQPADLAALQGFGPSFMIGGALNFVGTFAPITKTMAIDFAKRFYCKLLGAAGNAPLCVGEALRATKESFALEGRNDPSYLFYCLYGPGDSTYELE